MNTKTTLSISEARKKLFEMAKKVQKPSTHYILTEKGKPKVAFMSAEEFESWQETLEVLCDFPNLEKDIKKAEKKTEIKKPFFLEEIKENALMFIKKYYPMELSLFDMAWRVFKDIALKDIRREAFSESLGISGDEKVKLFTPEVIIILSTLSKEHPGRLNEDRIVQRIAEVGNQIGTSKDLIKNLTQYVLKSFKNYSK